eukprot:scaffold4961_cov114-Isochrysis_galbana.AAC.16
MCHKQFRTASLAPSKTQHSSARQARSGWRAAPPLASVSARRSGAGAAACPRSPCSARPSGETAAPAASRGKRLKSAVQRPAGGRTDAASGKSWARALTSSARGCSAENRLTARWHAAPEGWCEAAPPWPPGRSGRTSERSAAASGGRARTSWSSWSHDGGCSRSGWSKACRHPASSARLKHGLSSSSCGGCGKCARNSSSIRRVERTREGGAGAPLTPPWEKAQCDNDAWMRRSTCAGWVWVFERAGKL